MLKKTYDHRCPLLVGDKGFVTISDINQYVTDKIKTWAIQHSRVQTPTLQYTVVDDIVLVKHVPDVHTTLDENTLIVIDESSGNLIRPKDIEKISFGEKHGKNSN